MGKTWVSNNTQVESKEGNKGRVRDGPVERKEREERVEERGKRWVLVEEEAAVLEGVEERESVGYGGDQAICGWRCIVGHASYSEFSWVWWGVCGFDDTKGRE